MRSRCTGYRPILDAFRVFAKGDSTAYTEEAIAATKGLLPGQNGNGIHANGASGHDMNGSNESNGHSHNGSHGHANGNGVAAKASNGGKNGKTNGQKVALKILQQPSTTMLCSDCPAQRHTYQHTHVAMQAQS